MSRELPGMKALLAQAVKEGWSVEEAIRRTLEAAQGQPGVTQALRESVVSTVEYTSKTGAFERGVLSLTFQDPETMERALDELNWVTRQDVFFAITVGEIIRGGAQVSVELTELAAVLDPGTKLYTSKPEAVFVNYEELDKPDVYLRWDGDGQFGDYVVTDEKHGSGYFSSARVREMLGRRGVLKKEKET